MFVAGDTVLRMFSFIIVLALTEILKIFHQYANKNDGKGIKQSEVERSQEMFQT